MNKAEFLGALRQSLRGFSDDEINKVIYYYDELISDSVEEGRSEYQVVAEFGDIKRISRQIQADLADERLSATVETYQFRTQSQSVRVPDEVTSENKEVRKEKKSGIGTFFLVLKLFSAPALIPLGFVFFILWIVAAIVVGSLVFSFGVTSLACAASIFIGLFAGASQGGAGTAMILSAAMMLCTGLFGLLTVAVAKYGVVSLRYILKAAIRLVRLFNSK